MYELFYAHPFFFSFNSTGHGEYGEVFLAKATGLGDNSETVVMVKALESKEEHVISDFKRELSIYMKMKHENVGTVLRVCQDVTPHYMIMDYTDWVKYSPINFCLLGKIFSSD